MRTGPAIGSINHAPRRRAAKVAVVLATVVAIVLATVQTASASVSPTPLNTADVNGVVWAVAQVGNRTIVGGDFTTVGGLPRHNAAAILPDGTVDPAFDPNPNGIVRGVAGSDDGTRVFLGGEFTAVGATPRASLAAVDATTGEAITGWQADTNGVVHAVVVKGSRVYAGGTFTSIGTATRRRLAALDVTTASVHLGFNPWPDWTVKSIAVSPDATKVYAAGGFGAIGGQPRNGGAEVLSSTGAATSFNPSEGGVALTLALSPDGSRFFFSTTNNRLYAYDPAVSNVPVYVVQTSGDTQAIAASATEVYMGGHFSQLQTYRLKRSLIASIRLSDGAPTDWAPKLSTASQGMGPWAITVTSDRVLVGGDFTRVNNIAQPGLAIFTGTP